MYFKNVILSLIFAVSSLQASDSMKAIQINEYGGSEVLILVENAPIPQPERGEVQVQVVCAGLNPVDWKIVEGRLKTRMPNHLPIIPGWDVSGVITKVGPEVKQFQVGDLIYGYVRKATISNNGTYAEYVVCDESAIASIPTNLTFAQAASTPLSALTALQGLQGKVKPGDTVFVQGGAGGVGGYAIQIARYLGASKIITTSSKNEEYVRSLGATDVINYAQSDLFQALKEIAPEGIDVFLDSVEIPISENTLNSVKKGGFLVSLLDNKQPKDVEQIEQEKGVHYSYLFVKPDGEGLRELSVLFESGMLKPLPVEIFPMEQIKIAFDKLKSKHVIGKLVLVFSPK